MPVALQKNGPVLVNDPIVELYLKETNAVCVKKAVPKYEQENSNRLAVMMETLLRRGDALQRVLSNFTELHERGVIQQAWPGHAPASSPSCSSPGPPPSVLKKKRMPLWVREPATHSAVTTMVY